MAAEPAPDGTVEVRGSVAVFTVPQQRSQRARIDYVNARPMVLPQGDVSMAAPFEDGVELSLRTERSTAAPKKWGDFEGDGRTNFVFLGQPAREDTAPEPVPQRFGTAEHPFTTVRADAFQGTTNRQFPFRASGKLFMSIGSYTATCTASMIDKGIVLTAAHCLAEYGVGFYADFEFVPGYRKGDAPYGTWQAQSVAVPNSYLKGTASCAVPGVVCVNDIGVIRLVPQNGEFAGQHTGHYGFATGGYGFASGLTHVTQIGYPSCLDYGERMQRTDSFGYRDASQSHNTIIGSLMCSGSSGGPLILNFGKRPKLNGITSGAGGEANTVIGVTSWGYGSWGPKQQGASPFTDTNIGELATILCGGSPDPC
jgi:V8-like Glu-specific endopeptidase